MGQRESVFGGYSHDDWLCTICMGINTELLEGGSKGPVT